MGKLGYMGLKRLAKVGKSYFSPFLGPLPYAAKSNIWTKVLLVFEVLCPSCWPSTSSTQLSLFDKEHLLTAQTASWRCHFRGRLVFFDICSRSLLVIAYEKEVLFQMTYDFPTFDHICGLGTNDLPDFHLPHSPHFALTFQLPALWFVVSAPKNFSGKGR